MPFTPQGREYITRAVAAGSHVKNVSIITWSGITNDPRIATSVGRIEKVYHRNTGRMGYRIVASARPQPDDAITEHPRLGVLVDELARRMEGVAQ